MKRLYKYIDESIIGRKSVLSKWNKMKTIPKRNELKHLDILICANREIFVCLDKRLCTQGLWSNVIQKTITHNPRNFDAYRLSFNQCIDSLGLRYFNSELKCPSNHPFDVQYVYEYRNDLNSTNYNDFSDLWSDLSNNLFIKNEKPR